MTGPLGGHDRRPTRRTLLRGTAAAIGITAGAGLFGTRAAYAVSFYNPFGGYPVTGTWQDHLNDGSLGGIDLGMGVGTRLPAAGGGTVRNIPDNGTGGHTVTIHHDNGYRTQYMHLSQFLLADGASVGTGGIVGLSGGQPGASGSGSSTGPHLHWHMIDPNGVRIDPLVYLGGGSGGGLPKTSTEQDGEPGTVFWQRAQRWLSIESGYTGPIDGDPGANTYAALQRNLRDHYGYAGPIDGEPGPNTWAALQRLAAAHGYTGPVDGEMGPNSWRGVARFLNQDRWD
ncbi:peptidoglycan DD-metalloendopeptidase family protein [Streptomyces sp. BE147]|uniref:peptidoglycan DD-metalloendopeptidase family protein n=1 Tax=Streptomyces sp. BE147 TaxID=3002524 RepID=UPI002E79158A|nr:peptidoglycan DD-metalloendopeptidase family protein [Streptomyces sp. BE147]MEE1736797.1 peptidoglycan DD-metalloendopeptidase family protein [Streptomyces sp. BE147]